MAAPRSRAFGAALLLVVSAVGTGRGWAAPARDASLHPPAFAAARELLSRWRAYRAAEDALIAARWTATLGAVRISARDRERADSAYAATLRRLPVGTDMPILAPSERIALAMDWLDRGRPELALRLLRTAPGSAESRVLRAVARTRLEGGRAGLEELGWPGSGRRETAPIASDEAGLFLAAAIADSIGDLRCRRAALWSLASDDRPPAARAYARLALARTLGRGREPRLARAFLEAGEPSGTEETLLRSELLAAVGDTLGALRSLVTQAARQGLSAAERYACAKRAAVLARGARLDSIPEPEWIALARALGDLGEAPLALSLSAERRAAPPDTASARAREELQASLLLKARRFAQAADAYRTLLARPDSDASARAAHALGLARSSRGARRFASMDSAFALAVRIDPKGSTAETAAWERAREWEDGREPQESAPMLTWALEWIRTPALRSAAMLHAALAFERAGRADSARALMGQGEAADGTIRLWRGLLALAAGDSGAARRSLRSAADNDRDSYEGIRAAELLQSLESARRDDSTPPGPAGRPVRGPGAVPTAKPAAPSAAVPADRALGVLRIVGFSSLAEALLRECARNGPGPGSDGCVDALERIGIYRAGRVAAEREPRFRHPPAFPSAVMRAADAESLPATLLWALMRQESAYDPKARSRAGALGLLQLLPSTASALAARAIPEDSLTHPDLNVALGARYVRALLREFGDARAAMAAYNAGEDAVRRWSASRPAVDDRWVESIPYRETRDYVKQVYAAWRRYESIYGTAGSP